MNVFNMEKLIEKINNTVFFKHTDMVTMATEKCEDGEM